MSRTSLTDPSAQRTERVSRHGIGLTRICCLFVCLTGCVAAGTAFAQAAATDPGSTTIPEKTAPKTDLSTSGGTLSEKLSTTNGVIHPEDSVDPKIQKQPPATGTMPVIKPPGSPGGPTDVQPK